MLCESCGKHQCVRGLKYCVDCLEFTRRQMHDSGYLRVFEDRRRIDHHGDDPGFAKRLEDGFEIVGGNCHSLPDR